MTDTLPWTRHRPLPVTAAGYSPRRMLNITRLTAPEKRAIWNRIQTERPALAALLREPQLRALVETFGAEITVEPFEESEHDRAG